MARTEVLVKIDSDDRDQETGLSPINTDVSAEDAQRENGAGSVLPRDNKTGDQGNSQSSTEATLPSNKAAVGEVEQRGDRSKVPILQMVILVSTIAALLCSLLVSKLKRLELCSLSLWKWALMALVLMSGRLVSSWIVWVVLYFMEQDDFLKKRVLYFVYVLRKRISSCIWLSIVLVVWVEVIYCKLEKETKNRALPYIAKIFAGLLVSYFIWLLKTLLVKVLVMSFDIKAFFEQLRKAMFNQYVIKKLISPLDKKKGLSGKMNECFTSGSRGGFLKQYGGGEFEMSGLLNKEKKNISALIMTRMRSSIKGSDFLTLDQDSGATTKSQKEKEKEKEIRTEDEARKAAESIFCHVTKYSQRNDGRILLEDVKKFMPAAEAVQAMKIFQEAADADAGVGASSFCDWMVGAFRQKKALSSSLSDTKSAIDDILFHFNIFTIVIIIIFWFFILGVRAPGIMIYIAAQLILLVFIFGNTCKTVFESFVFLFVMHPFNVGDLCEVDGVKMVVKKMKIFTTEFIGEHNQKILFPNTVLATKPITNYNRSQNVRDVVNITVDVSTPTETLLSMQQQIQWSVEGKGERGGQVSVKMAATDMGENNKVKMSVWVEHKMNNEKLEERLGRRATLVQCISNAVKDHLH